MRAWHRTPTRMHRLIADGSVTSGGRGCSSLSRTASVINNSCPPKYHRLSRCQAHWPAKASRASIYLLHLFRLVLQPHAVRVEAVPWCTGHPAALLIEETAAVEDLQLSRDATDERGCLLMTPSERALRANLWQKAGLVDRKYRSAKCSAAG